MPCGIFWFVAWLAVVHLVAVTGSEPAILIEQADRAAATAVARDDELSRISPYPVRCTYRSRDKCETGEHRRSVTVAGSPPPAGRTVQPREVGEQLEQQTSVGAAADPQFRYSSVVPGGSAASR
jgi:hypothetical protein